MGISLQKITGYRAMGKYATISFMLLLIIALVLMPYRFHAASGTFGKSAAFAKDGGDDGGSGGGDGGGSGGDDGAGGDDGGVSSGGDDGGDQGDDGASGGHDAAVSGDEDGGHEGGEDNGAAGDSDTGSSHGAGNGPGALIGAGGLQGLSPVSAAEEAGLVGNWGGQSNPGRK